MENDNEALGELEAVLAQESFYEEFAHYLATGQKAKAREMILQADAQEDYELVKVLTKEYDAV